MEIDKLAPLAFPISTFSLSHPTAGSNFPSRQTHPANRERENRGIITRPQSDFINLQKINDTLNAIAKGQRGLENRFQKLDNYLERMKAQLEQIVKQFPPFPPGSEDRVRALRAYAFFRHLIDQLTIPPRDEVQTKAMDELINTSETSDVGEGDRF
jgi:hypothetical protein